MKTFKYFWSYLAQFFFEGEIFRQYLVQKIKIYFMVNTFSSKIV